MAYKIVPAKPRKSVEIDSLALDIVKKYQPGVLTKMEMFDIESFFEFELEEITKVKTAYRPLTYGVYGLTDSDKLLSIVSSELAEDDLQECFFRSTLSHESGHGILHVWEFRTRKAILSSITNKENGELKMYRDCDIPVYMNPEWQAWRFAGALLMPEPAISKAISKGYTVNDMARTFSVNPAFVRTRLKALKIQT